MKNIVFLLLFLLTSCGGNPTVRPSVRRTPPAVANKPAPATSQSASTPSNGSSPTTAADAAIGDNSKKPGGYYLDDGPDANTPKEIDAIPDATPKKEPLLARSNKPYKALGTLYTPMSSAQNYKERGIASWYGKRFHGKKTASGEIYDMYAMSAAHTTLPLPSYAKVTNPANGRSVVVRVNDRGPFRSTRIIDLSYAAAYKLRLVNQGSGMVDVEAIHPDEMVNSTTATPAPTSNHNPYPATPSASTNPSEVPAAVTVAAETPSTVTMPATEIKPIAEVLPVEIKPITQPEQSTNSAIVAGEYFIQAGAFKNEANADALLKKIQGLEIEQNVGINRVYNNGLHRLKLGPYDSKKIAEQVASNIRKQLNISTIITNQ